MRNDFAIFILTHGRADTIVTVKSIQRAGYTGNWYLILDDEDEQIPDYKNKFGDEHCIIFSKDDIEPYFDIMDNYEGRQVPVYARNILHGLAMKMGLTYFLSLEDDAANFRYRYVAEDGRFGSIYLRDMDTIIDIYLEYLEESGAKCVAFSQTGDLIGGPSSHVWIEKLARKVMNCYFCKTDRPFQWFGRFNDDVNCYIENGKRGDLFLTVSQLAMDELPTQKNSGGITKMYQKYGTYVKSFYSVLLCPASVFIREMGMYHPRIHHCIDWPKTVPMIVSGGYKK